MGNKSSNFCARLKYLIVFNISIENIQFVIHNKALYMAAHTSAELSLVFAVYV